MGNLIMRWNILKEVAWILKDTVRDGDVVGRWGGEEFLIIVHSNKINAVKLAQSVGFDNINLDLIYGLPTQTIKNIEKDIQITLNLGIQHISTGKKNQVKN